MWETIPQSSGLTTMVLDLTNDLLPLIVGLIVLTCLSAVMIAAVAIKYSLSQRTNSAEEPAATPADHQDAA
jgi:hypothetical protein